MKLNAAIVVKLALTFLVASSEGAGARKETPEQKWHRIAKSLNSHAGSPNKLALARKAISEIKSNFGGHTKSFFENLKLTGAEYLFSQLTGADDRDAYQNGSGSPKQMEVVGKALTKDDYETMNDDVCRVLVRALESMTNVQYIKEECRGTFLTNLAGVAVRETTIKGIPAQWVEADTEKLAHALRRFSRETGKNVITHVNNKTFEAMVKSDSDGNSIFCTHIPARLLNDANTEKRKKVSASCMASVERLDTTDMTNLADYKNDIFSKYNGALTDPTIKKITRAQLPQFASSVNEDNRCAALNLAALSADAAGALTSKCLYGHLSARADSSATFGRILKSFPTAAFKWDASELETFGKLNSSDYQYLSAEIIQFILDNENAVKALPRIESSSNVFLKEEVKKVTVTADTFNRLAEQSPTLASQVFAQATTLPTDVLIKVEPDHINALIGKGHDGDVTGFAFLSANRTRDGFRAIINVMGDKANTHVCSTITKAEDYLAMDWLRPIVGAECKKNLPFNNDIAVLQQAPELAQDSDEVWQKMIKDEDLNAWKNINKGMFAVFAGRKGFCQALAKDENKEILANLSDSLLAVIGAECAVEMAAVITEQLAPKLRDDAFALFTVKNMKVSLKALTVPQVPFVSAHLADAQMKEHVFTAMTVEKLTELDNARFVVISAKQWGVISVDVLKVFFTAENIKSVPAANMANLSDAVLEALSERVLLALSEEQILAVGKEVNASLKALEKLASKMDQPRQDALKQRLEAYKKAEAPVKEDPKESKEESSHMIWWIVGASVGVIIIGGIVFLLIRRREPTQWSK